MNLRIAEKIVRDCGSVAAWRSRRPWQRHRRRGQRQGLTAFRIVLRARRRGIRWHWPTAAGWFVMGKDIFYGPPWRMWLCDKDAVGLCPWGLWRDAKWAAERDGEETGLPKLEAICRRTA
jgi:hypothetical protein